MDSKTFEVIERISQEHCKKTFGYLNEDDLKNEIWVICLERIKDYTPERGELEHFLRVAVKSRLINRFKDITKNVRSPCPRCPFFNPGAKVTCGKFGEQKNLCDKWNIYQLFVESRNSLLNSAEQTFERKVECGIAEKIATEELRDKIKAELPSEFLHDFNRFTNGETVSRQRLKKLNAVVLALIEELGINEEAEPV